MGGPLPVLAPPPESVGLYFPESLARGRRRQGCDGGVAAAGGERRPLSGLAWDRPRPQGSGLWGGAVRQLAGSRLPGGNNPPGRWSGSQDLQAMGYGAALGLLRPLSLGDHPLLPFWPQEMAALSPQPGQGLCLPAFS